MTDVVARAKSALEGVSGGPWKVTGGVVWREDVIAVPDPMDRTGQTPMPERLQEKVCDTSVWEAPFIAAARDLVPELVDEVERLRSAAKTLGKIIDDSLTDVLKATDSYDVIGEDGDGDWMLVFERLMELRPARDAALAEVERLRSDLAYFGIRPSGVSDV